MKQLMATLTLALTIALPARADVKVVQNISGKGPLAVANGASTTYIKGLKMRTDSVSGSTTRSMIFDVENQKLYIFDSKKKEAEVWDMAAFSSEVGAAVDTSQMTASLKPNGQTKEIAGKSATAYDMAVSVPARFGGDKDGMKMIVNLTGPVWIVKGAPGTDDYNRFFKGAAERGWIFTDPRAAKAQPGQARAMAEMYNQFAATGGLAYENEITIKMSGEGPMAGLMARMGNMSMTSTVTSVDAAPLGDELFAPPAGYKLTAKK